MYTFRACVYSGRYHQHGDSPGEMGWYSRDALLQKTRIKDANCLGRDLFS
jgi:hypothetical protein